MPSLFDRLKAAAASDWRAYTGCYFFNPFGEYFIAESERIDNTELLQLPAYYQMVGSAVARLDLMPVGTRVATFHGMGAPLPPDYDLVGRRVCKHPHMLERGTGRIEYGSRHG